MNKNDIIHKSEYQQIQYSRFFLKSYLDYLITGCYRYTQRFYRDVSLITLCLLLPKINIKNKNDNIHKNEVREIR